MREGETLTCSRLKSPAMLNRASVQDGTSEGGIQ
jgi:hypothetical protein